jgi:hypothetical protein
MVRRLLVLPFRIVLYGILRVSTLHKTIALAIDYPDRCDVDYLDHAHRPARDGTVGLSALLGAIRTTMNFNIPAQNVVKVIRL